MIVTGSSCCAHPRTRESGQATVEFALILPLVVMLAIGLVQVARLSALQVVAVDAAYGGARAASVDPRPSVARDAALRRLPGSQVMTTFSTTQDGTRLVTVQVSRPMRAMPLIGWSTVRLAASSSMAVEDDS